MTQTLKKREQAFGTKFAQWYKLPENKFWPQASFEYKVTVGGTYNLNTWRKKQGHQEVNLTKASDERGVFHTFTDLDPRGTPFDGIFISMSPAFLVVLFEQENKFFIIPVLEVPHKTSISYGYCLQKWGAYEFPAKTKKQYVI